MEFVMFMYADEPSLPGSHLVGALVIALCWLVEAHTKTAVHRVKVSKGSSPIVVASPCPVVAGVEVAVLESSRLPVRTKSGVRAMGMTSVHEQGRGGGEAIAGDHFAAETRLESNSA